MRAIKEFDQLFEKLEDLGGVGDLLCGRFAQIMIYFILEKDIAIHQHAIDVLQLLEVGALGISKISFET